MQQTDHPTFGLILDSFHALSLGDTLDGLNNVPTNKLFLVQSVDTPRLSVDVLSWSRHHCDFPGQGDLPVTNSARDLLATGYTGPLSLEIFNDDLCSAPVRLTTLDGMRSLLRLESEAGGAELSATVRFEGVDFLEFAVDAIAGREPEMRLRTLGFVFAGYHRSKAVDLYRQGRVNVILNMEQDSTASERFELHGSSACAIGSRVDDAGRAVAHAHVLCIQEWRGPVGSAECSIPALRVPDGMLFYLIDDRQVDRSIYKSDFVPHPGMQDDAAGLVSIDHVAQALPAHRLDSFVLFYRVIFGMEAELEQEIAGPYGLMKSRAMTSPDRNVRIPLNILESGRTATGRFIAAYVGPGVHHIALRTERLFEVIEAIDRGVAHLRHAPENYYDDIVARLRLDDALLTRLHDNGLFYDRDPYGDFLHTYTEPFRERFSFELVQCNGYLGYGAANVAVHMAVQAQLSRTTTNTVDH